MPLHSRKMLGLTSALPKPVKIAIVKKTPEEDGDSGGKDEMLRHHLDDIKEALMKCYKALDGGDLDEVRECAAIIQASASDVEKIVKGEE